MDFVSDVKNLPVRSHHMKIVAKENSAICAISFNVFAPSLINDYGDKHGFVFDTDTTLQ
jgi:hypothetical protein